MKNPGQERTSQTMPTPIVAASNPALRKEDGGTFSIWSAILRIPSGKRAYKPPSITRISAMAIISSSGTADV